jgi:hypothetical protein
VAQLKLETTVSEGLRPLGAPGQRSYELVSPAVRRALGDACADLFAEPVASPRGDAIDWYSPVPGAGRRLADLSPDEARILRDRLAELVAAVFAHADRLAASPDAASQNLAQALRNALEVPDETAIFAVGDQPVLINWAHRRDVRQAPQGLLQAMVASRAPAAPNPVAPPAAATAAAAPAAAAPAADEPAARRPSDWLWWAVAAATGAAMAAALWLLVAPCGLAGPSWLNRCPAPAEEAVVDPALGARRAQLEAEIAALERRALAAERACEPAPPPPPPAPAPAPAAVRPSPPPAPPAPDEIDRRREDAGGQEGELTITLVWDSTADLDLYVACPGGGEISYERPTACGGGRLDVDANVRRRTTTPVENVFFGEGAPRGTYRVRVNMFDDGGRGGSVHPFTVRIDIGGRRQTFRGEVSARQRVWSQTFEHRG